MTSPRKVLFLVLLVLVANGGCAPSEGELCRVVDKEAFCGEEYKLPENISLEHIEIRSKKLTTVGKHDFASYENLKVLDLSNSDVQHIDQDSFIFNTKLEDLNLSGNKDLQIPTKSSFISSKSLTNLNMSHTAIEELPDNMFAELPNLKTIDLSSTDIMEFTSLRNLKNINTLLISENSELHKSDLCNETSLQQIIEVENDKKITFDCPKKPNLTNTTKQETEEKQEEKPETTEIPNTKETKIFEILNTENDNKEPENLLNPKNIYTTEKSETLKELNVSVNETSQIDIKPVISQVNDTIKTENLENSEENKGIKDKVPENKMVNVPEPSLETNKTESETNTSTEPGKTDPEKTDAENTDAGNTNVETPVVGNNETNKTDSNKTDTNKNDTEITDADKKGVQNNELDNNAQKIEPNQKNTTTHEDIKDISDASRPAPNEAQTSGTNIVLGIILCVMIVGALGFGYRYWRNRRSGYRNANTEDVEEGKELQNMVGHHVNSEEQT